MSLIGRVCAKGVWDETVPGISFDESGASNYSKIFNRMVESYPRGAEGLDQWNKLIQQIKIEGINKKYDCIIGVSGGTDSSFLLHMAKKVYGLRALAVTFDNGWSSDIAVKNIKRMTNSLDIDLETYVVDYEEMKSIHKAYMKAGLPWVDFPTDFAIKNTLLQTARREKIKYIFSGHDFRSEGTQPNEWTHGDSKQLRHITKQFSSTNILSLPFISFFNQLLYTKVGKIEIVKPFYYLDYQKKVAQELLQKEYGWEYYGGHHHENIFTKFVISYWLPRKFGIDKRKITLSAQVMSGEVSRDTAVQMLNDSPYDPQQMELDKEYVLKKLELEAQEFEAIWNAPNKSVYDYPSYLGTLLKFKGILRFLFKITNRNLPSFLYQIEERY